MKVVVAESCLPAPLHLELRAQPLTDPLANVLVDVAIGFAERADAEIVAPTAKLAVDPTNLLIHVQPGRLPSRHLMDRVTESAHFLPRRSSPKVGVPRPRIVVPTQGITQKIKRLIRQAAEPRLRLVHRQL